MLVVMYMYMVILCIFMLFDFFFLMIRRPPRSTRTDTLFPYTTLFRSALDHFTAELRGEVKRDNIMVTLFSPGAVATGSIANFDPAVLPGAMGAWLEKGATFDGVTSAQPRDKALVQRGSRSEEHTSELQSLMRISYAVFCLKKKKATEQ